MSGKTRKNESTGQFVWIKVYIGGFKGAPGTCAPLGSFIFMQFFGKKWPNNKLSPSLELVPL